MYSQQDTSVSTIVWVQKHHTFAMATGHNVDWHSNSMDALNNDSNLMICDYLHVPALIDGHLAFVKKNDNIGISLNECEIIQKSNVMINWQARPMRNVKLYQTPEFKNVLLTYLYRDVNYLEKEVNRLKDQVKQNKNDNDTKQQQTTQAAQVLQFLILAR